MVTAAASSVPEALLTQLVDGGVLVIPVGNESQQLLKVVRNGANFTSAVVEMVRFVPLVQGELA